MRQSADSYLFPGAFAPVLSLDELLAGPDDEIGPRFELPDESPSAENLLVQLESIAAVERFLARLSPRDREIITRLFWNDETQTQVAASLGVSKMAICKALARICRQARIYLAAATSPVV
jgi:RNA polymerase sigma factor (sigma-70 family)